MCVQDVNLLVSCVFACMWV
uniref:Uncharacterized protein n=1 Tax=Anguilla anguilla TaxID=7936 RepID=A0A0E9VDN0_ANGAN